MASRSKGKRPGKSLVYQDMLERDAADNPRGVGGGLMLLGLGLVAVSVWGLTRRSLALKPPAPPAPTAQPTAAPALPQTAPKPAPPAAPAAAPKPAAAPAPTPAAAPSPTVNASQIASVLQAGASVAKDFGITLPTPAQIGQDLTASAPTDPSSDDTSSSSDGS